MKNTKTKTGETAPARRDFLKGAAVASVAASAGVLATNAVADEASGEKVTPRKLGYQETDHVRDYYRLARF